MANEFNNKTVYSFLAENPCASSRCRFNLFGREKGLAWHPSTHQKKRPFMSGEVFPHGFDDSKNLATWTG